MNYGNNIYSKSIKLFIATFTIGIILGMILIGSLVYLSVN